MIRPFGLGDIALLMGLQRSSAALAIEHILTHPRAPLWIALTAPWPWAGTGVATYVLREKRPEGRLAGFVQLIQRASRPEADLLHLSPALSMAAPGDDGGAFIWDQLLAHSAAAAAGHGLQRVFASIPDGGLEDGRLRSAGFSLYTRETIYRLAVAPGFELLPSIAPAGFRLQAPQDSWALQRVYTRGTPLLVQHAEGAITGDVGSPPLSWWEPDRWTGLVWEPAGEVRGAVQVHLGQAGHWMRIWGANTLAPRELRSLIAEGLRTITPGPPRQGRAGEASHSAAQAQGGFAKPAPVYVTVRDYEVGMTGALTGFGFAPYTDRLRFVRHIGAKERKTALAPLSTMEVRQALTRSAPETGKAPVHCDSQAQGLIFPSLEVERKK